MARFSGPKQQDQREQRHNQHPREKAGGHDSVVNGVVVDRSSSTKADP